MVSLSEQQKQVDDMGLIYKIIMKAEWEKAQKTGKLLGSPVDLEDGFIHFSTATQLEETANKHFKGLHDLVLLGVDENMIETNLRYEISRNGEFFPHLYGDFLLDAIKYAKQISSDETGRFHFSELEN